jgi:putative oxidoreductase
MNAVATTLTRVTSPMSKLGPVVPIVLRVVLGLTMFWHGYKKFDAGLDQTKQFFDFLSIPLPGFFAVVVAVLELVGGLMIVVGLLTRFIAALFIVELLVAVLRFKYGEDIGFIGVGPAGAGAELDWALIVGFFVLAVQGPGTMSVDHRLGLDT